MPPVNGRYVVVDLASGEAREAELPAGFGSTLGSGLFDQVDSIMSGLKDPIAIGSGPATATFVPAACAGFAMRPGAQPYHERVCVLTGTLGVELKLSGFDIVVLEGSAPEPGYLWVRDGIAEFVPSPGSPGLDSWQRTDSIRAEQGDRKIQVVTVGPWGDRGMETSQLILDYWGGEDKIGFAAEFGRRNLVAAAFRGMGEIEIDDPEGHFAKCMALRERHKASLGRSAGLASFSDTVRMEGYAELRHRDVGCFGCPYPCRTFYKVAEDPKTMKLENREPGYLAYDIPSVETLSASGLSPRDVVVVLTACAKAGAEPVAVVDCLKSDGEPVTLDAVLSKLDGRGCSDRADRAVRGAFVDPGVDTDAAMDCIAAGLCPRYWSKVGFDPASVAAALGL